MDIREFTMDFFSLKGRKAVVTGGNTGLGQAFAVALAKGGADVMVPSIIDDDGTTGALIATEGVRYEYLKADITTAGGAVIAQDEATSVVWGMPGSAAHSGVCSAVLPLPDIAPRIVRLFSGGRP